VTVPWNWLWLTVAFLTELAALAALAVWGWSVPSARLWRVVLAVGTPAVAAVLWGLFAAPRAVVDVPVLAVLVKIVVFGAATLALVATGHPRLAGTLAVLALLSSLLSSAPPVSGPGAA
jgi:hypothetical protein